MKEILRKQVLENEDVIIFKENVDKLSEEEFAECRHTSFGASDSSRLLNVNPFPEGTFDAVLNEKINKIVNEEIGKKPTVRMGKDLEPLIISKLEKILETKIYKPTDMFLNTRTGQSVNFDGVSSGMYGKLYPNEIKTVSVWGRKNYDYTKAYNLDEDPIHEPMLIHSAMTEVPVNYKPEIQDEIERLCLYNAELAGIPVYYYTQLQQQIDFLGSDFGTLDVLDVASWTVFRFALERNQKVIDALQFAALKAYTSLKIKTGI